MIADSFSVFRPKSSLIYQTSSISQRDWSMYTFQSLFQKLGFGEKESWPRFRLTSLPRNRFPKINVRLGSKPRRRLTRESCYGSCFGSPSRSVLLMLRARLTADLPAEPCPKGLASL